MGHNPLKSFIICLTFRKKECYNLLVMKNLSITTLLNSESVDIMDLWYDWFCRDTYLPKKGERLFEKLIEISNSKKFDSDRCYVFFKNNCPCDGRLYDDFRICDRETGKVLYTITPSCGFNCLKNKAVVWGHENDFEEALVVGTWNKVVKWFLENN